MLSCFVILSIWATNAIIVKPKLKALTALNSSVSVSDIPGNYGAGIDALFALSPMGYTEAEFPYHGITHAGSFRTCAKAAIAARQGPWQVQFAAEVYGYYHDAGYKVAVAAQAFTAVPDLWASEVACPAKAQGKGTKLGVDHEKQSVILADAAVTKALADDRFKGEGEFKEMGTVLSDAKFKVYGHALIAGTPAKLPDRQAAYNEGIGAPIPVGTKEEFEAALAALPAVKWTVSAKDMLQVAHNGDFCYLEAVTSVCQQMNCFAEFYTYGGVEQNTVPKVPPEEAAKGLGDELGKFIAGQSNFVGYVINGVMQKNYDAKPMQKILDAVIADDTCKNAANLKALKAGLLNVGAFTAACKFDTNSFKML